MTNKIFLVLLCLQAIALTACAGSAAPADSHTNSIPVSPTPAGDSTANNTCKVTDPVWAKPPDDPAVQGSPGYGYYFVNEDRSIWASAWWQESEDDQLQASKEGIKIGWFRPAGVELEITGQRIDAQAMPLEAQVPCCYPTRFQATGLLFPSEGCWQVTARAGDSELSFTVQVVP